MNKGQYVMDVGDSSREDDSLREEQSEDNKVGDAAR